MEVIDNFLPEGIFRYIRNCCISKNEAKLAYYIGNTNDWDDRINFTCNIQDPNHPHADLFMPIVAEVASRLSIDPMSLMRIRVAITPQAKANDIKARHIDNDIPHWAALFYLNDSDGDTVFWKGGVGDEIIERVTPKSNRVVIFDGSTYHSSSSPCDAEFRAVVNLNFAK